MSSADRVPTGMTGRRRRISDEETARRMLRAAVATVTRTGLTVSLEHLSFEDLIRDAGVSRSAAYRRWPYKDLFLADLVRQLAAAAGEGALPEDAASARLIGRITLEHIDWLDTAELRHQLVVEILRQSAPENFGFFHGSAAWRTYLALHATFLGLPAGELRDDIHAALARSEKSVVAEIATAYEQWSGLLGYRIRPELGATFTTMGTLLNATMRGLVLMAPTIDDIASARVPAAPFGATTEREWSQPALAIASVALSFLEPDPAITWDGARLEWVRHALGENIAHQTGSGTVGSGS